MICECVLLLGIRTALMESPDHTCPNCETPGQSPDVLIPNKYLRGMVTSFINETSYVSAKKPPVTATASTSSASTNPPAPMSAARTVAIKSEPLVTDSGRRPTDLPSHLIGMPPQVVRVAQIKSEPMSTDLASSRQPQHPAARTQSPKPVPGGHQFAVRTIAGENYGYQPSRSTEHGTAAAHHIPSHHVSGYLPPAAVAVSGSNVSHSQSAPSLLSHKQPEYVWIFLYIMQTLHVK